LANQLLHPTRDGAIPESNTEEGMIAVFDIDGTLRRAPDPWLGLHRLLGTDDRGEEFQHFDWDGE
jgi:hypothetical protein